MKKSLMASLALAFSISSFAQLSGNGYYRLQNYMSGRYAYIVNNKGKISVATTSADLTSIALWSDEAKALADPSTVIYITDMGSNSYNLAGQGTSMYDIIGYYLKVKDNGDSTYKAYAEYAGNVIYVSDVETSDFEKGALGTSGKQRWRDWYIKPVDKDDNSYVGVKPDIEVNGKYYKSYYASFPFDIKSQGVKAYYITKVDGQNVAFKEITDGKVPAATPVIFECSSENASDNRLTLVTENRAALTDNQLRGVYFNFSSASAEKRNQVTYDSKTMRVLGKMSDGSLGFVTNTKLSTIPANTAYIVVPEDAEAEIKLVPESDYTVGVEDVVADGDDNKPFNIYSTTGVLVRQNATSTEGLPAGIYISNGRKIVVKP
jgi:hypothetical protein